MLEAIRETSSLTRNSSGNNRPQSSQLAEPLWTDPGFWCARAISTFRQKERKKEKSKEKRRWDRFITKNFPPNPRIRGKRHHHHRQCTKDGWIDYKVQKHLARLQCAKNYSTKALSQATVYKKTIVQKHLARLQLSLIHI